MKLEIVTPEKKTFSDEVESVVIPGSEGEMEILPSHAALVSSLKPGELRYKKDGQESVLAVGEGVVEVSADNISVLTDLAVNESDIDEASVQEALERAQKTLAEIGPDEDTAAAQMAIMKSAAMLEIKRRRKGR